MGTNAQPTHFHRFKTEFFLFRHPGGEGGGWVPPPKSRLGPSGCPPEEGFSSIFRALYQKQFGPKIHPQKFSPRALRKHKTSELKTQRTSKRGGGSVPCPQRRWPPSVSGNPVALVATPSRPEPVSLCGSPRGSEPFSVGVDPPPSPSGDALPPPPSLPPLPLASPQPRRPPGRWPGRPRPARRCSAAWRGRRSSGPAPSPWWTATSGWILSSWRPAAARWPALCPAGGRGGGRRKLVGTALRGQAAPVGVRCVRCVCFFPPLSALVCAAMEGCEMKRSANTAKKCEANCGIGR